MEEIVRRLEVKVAPGFADSEYFVMVPDGPAAFVSRELVVVKRPPDEGSEVQGFLTVFVLEQGEHETLIELPGEPAVGGLRARVDNSLLVSQ